MISRSGEQSSIAFSVWSPGKNLTRCVHGMGEVRVQVSREERVLSA
jgi:hypothetical protein